MTRLLETIKERSLHNLSRIIADPELCVGEKQPSTGTGWAGILKTREGFGRAADTDAYMIEHTVSEYYDDLIASILDWPKYDSVINISGEWRGIRGGSRSDADCLEWTEDNSRIVTETQVRGVGTDPSSVLHNRTLNDREYQLDLYKISGTPITVYPMDIEGWQKVMSTPPVTAEFIKDEVVDEGLFSFDFGYTDSRFIPGSFDRTAESIKLGADNIWMTGIELRTTRHMPRVNRFMMLESGCPFTMVSYTPAIDGMIYEIAKSNSLSSIRVLGVGDDKQVTGKIEHLKVLAHLIGPWARTKGMDKGWVFVVGNNLLWESPDVVHMFMMPRAMKSMTSPNAVKSYPTLAKSLYIGDSLHLEVPNEILLEAQKLWELYPEMFFMSGTPQDVRRIVNRDYWSGRQSLASIGGVSEWTEDLYFDVSEGEYTEITSEEEVNDVDHGTEDRLESPVDKRRREEESADEQELEADAESQSTDSDTEENGSTVVTTGGENLERQDNEERPGNKTDADSEEELASDAGDNTDADEGGSSEHEREDPNNGGITDPDGSRRNVSDGRIEDDESEDEKKAS
jgi:hypothetical protein